MIFSAFSFVVMPEHDVLLSDLFKKNTNPRLHSSTLLYVIFQ